MAQFVIFLAAFCIRAIVVFRSAVHLSADACVYDNLARQIAGDGIISFRTIMNFPLKDHPVYPFFLSFLYAAFGPNYRLIWITQAAVGSLMCVLVYCTARELLGRRTAIIAGLMAAGYPVFVKLSVMMLTEGLFIFMFVLSFWLLVKYINGLKLKYLLFSACAFGVTVLTRSVVLPFGLVVPLYLFLMNRKRLAFRANGAHQALFIAVFICTILPWSIRNYFASGGQIIPVTEATDRGLYLSFCPVDGKIFGIKSDTDPVLVEARTITSFDERRKFFMSKTREFIRNRPREVVRLEILKVAYLWSPIDWEVLGNGAARYNFGFVFILPFFIYGSVRLLRSGMQERFLLFLPILYFQALHLVYFALPRFRVGFEPMLIILAGYGLQEGYARARRKRVFAAGVIGFFLLNVLLWFFSAELKCSLRWVCQAAGLW